LPWLVLFGAVLLVGGSIGRRVTRLPAR
jgi:hypothetical protein